MKKINLKPEIVLGGLGLLFGVGKMIIDGKSEEARQNKLKEEITENAVKSVMEKLNAKES